MKCIILDEKGRKEEERKVERTQLKRHCWSYWGNLNRRYTVHDSIMSMFNVRGRIILWLCRIIS